MNKAQWTLMILLSTMDKISIYLESNLVGPPVTIKIGIDDHCVTSLELPVHEFHFDYELNPGMHRLWIQMIGKTVDNEQRDNGNLVEDTFFKIKNVAINHSMMNHLLNDHGYVIVDWHKHPDVALWFKTHQGEIPERFDKNTYINLQGIYSFEFFTPISNFLSDNIQIKNEYKKMYNQDIEKYISLYEQVK